VSVVVNFDTNRHFLTLFLPEPEDGLIYILSSRQKNGKIRTTVTGSDGLDKKQLLTNFKKVFFSSPVLIN